MVVEAGGYSGGQVVGGVGYLPVDEVKGHRDGAGVTGAQ